MLKNACCSFLLSGPHCLYHCTLYNNYCVYKTPKEIIEFQKQNILKWILEKTALEKTVNLSNTKCIQYLCNNSVM